ncbi:MAG: hypothetical protein ACYDHX_07755 [Methanothrix sp.]
MSSDRVARLTHKHRENYSAPGREVRYVCDVCQERYYALGWSFNRVQAICRHICRSRSQRAEHLGTLGYAVTWDSDKME